MKYQDIFLSKIDQIKKENRYREFKIIDKNASRFPIVFDKKTDKDITIWCSNDYLGMSVNKDVINAFIDSVKKTGVGSGGTRNISGTTKEIVDLEEKIAKFHNKESGLVFTSGYISNLATISALASIMPDLIIFSDEKNHASIISGIRQNKSQKHIFKHNNLEDLEDLISQYSKDTPKLIIFEGVYSMDGSYPNITRIVEIAKKYNALTYIDEVHAVGLYGKSGGGISQLFGLEKEIDIIEGTFAKSFGVIGGYICTDEIIKDAIRSVGSSFIFTTSLPPAICSAILKSIDIVSSEEGNLLREKHFENVFEIKSRLVKSAILKEEQKEINTHIIPIVIGDSRKTNDISLKLFDDYQIYVQPINYPTVPIGQERLRITTSPLHTKDMIDLMIDGLCFFLGKSTKSIY